jgi:hypothetical protein
MFWYKNVEGNYKSIHILVDFLHIITIYGLLPNKNKIEKMLQQFLLLHGTSPTRNIIIKHYGPQGIKSLLISFQEPIG